MILRDPDEAMARSAAARHLDRRAHQLLTDPGFGDWFHAMATEVGEHEFLVRRLHASDWFQRTAVQILTSPAALRLLASDGRTRRVRTAADHQLAEQRR
ncbi:hypothetical protein ACIBP6_07020 [Nonomuraea terrae]|uniref:hypothetical protein n=1 Tax=Nonomuraea terrae TaxID=2530383 RepID=UPI003788A7CB